MERYNRDYYGYGDYESGNRGRYGDNREYQDDRERRGRPENTGHYSRVYESNTDYDRFPNYRSHSPDKNMNYYGRYNRPQSRFTEEENRYQSYHPGYADIRRGYGISDFAGTSDRYGTLNSGPRQKYWEEEQPYFSGNRDRNSSTGFSSAMGESFPHSHRGVPDYSNRNFASGPGTGMGSSYGGDNYGGGIGYEGGNRGGSLSSSTYGGSSGNYGGYGSMGGGAYGTGRGSYGGQDTHNSNRMKNELGGF